MAETVYVLCALTSVFCAALLIGNYRRTRAGLLLWTSLCFVGLALNNVLLFVDLVLLPNGPDLSVPRTGTAIVGLAVMVFGLVWEVR